MPEAPLVPPPPVDWPVGRVRIVVVSPGEDTMAKKLLTHMNPMCSSYGFCAVWHPGQLAPGTDEAAAIVARLDTADIAVLLVGPSTPFELQENLQDRKIPIIPVVVRDVDLSIGPLAGKLRLPRDNRGVGRTLTSVKSTDEVLVEIIMEIRGIAERYKDAAAKRRISNCPSWVEAFPPAWPDEDFQQFLLALPQAYDNSADIRTVLRAIGISPGSIYMEGASRNVWHDAVQAACNQGKLKELFDHVRRDANQAAVFAPWA